MIKFGEFDFYPKLGHLLYRGRRVRLQEQPLKILELLLETPGEIVSRKCIRAKLWAGSHIDHEHGINTAILRLRRTVEIRGRSGISIQTSPGHGYRLLISGAGVRPRIQTKLLELQVIPGQHVGVREDRLQGFLYDLASSLGQTTNHHVRIVAGVPSGDLLLSFSVLDWNDAVRLTAVLTNRCDNTLLWSASYIQRAQESLTMQGKLVDDVCKALTRVSDTPSTATQTDRMARTLAEPKTLDQEGYEAYLNGRFLFSQRNPRSLLAAKTEFEVACQRNPDFAFAHASLSRTYRFLTIFESSDPGPSWDAAEHHAQRAVQLDGRLSEALSSVACVIARYRWRWIDGCVAYEEALGLNPNDAETYCDYGVALLAMGEFEEAVRCLSRVVVLDPRYAVGRATLALGWVMQGRRKEAINMLNQMTEAMPDFLTAWIYLGVEQLNMGQWAEAEAALKRALSIARHQPTLMSLLAHAYAGQGNFDLVQETISRTRALAKQQYVSPTALAIAAMAEQDAVAALSAVRTVVTERDANFALYRKMRLFDYIRHQAEFLQTLCAMNLSNA